MLVHAENHDAIAWASQRLLAEGKTAPKYHAAVTAGRSRARSGASHHHPGRARRRQPADRARVERRRARADPLGARHAACQSTRRPARSICSSRRTISTGPASKARNTCSARRRATTPARMRSGVACRTATSTCSPQITRHIGSTTPTGKAVHGTDAPFTKIPNGMPGLETCLPLLFSEGVRQRPPHARAVRRIERHERGPHLRPVSAQGHDCAWRRCRPCDLGSRRPRHDYQRRAPSPHGLHAVRGQDGDGLAGRDDLTR